MPKINIPELLGKDDQYLLEHKSRTIPRSNIALPGPDFIDRVFAPSNRTPQLLRSLGNIFNHGRLRGTGYISILPVDQGVEHSAGSSFARNPLYFDPENIVKLAIEGGCSALATTYGNLAMISRKYAHKIPLIVKINHSELLTYPNRYNQIMFGSVKEAWNLGAAAIGCTVYFGSDQSDRQIQEVASAFEQAHELGMATILWCYLRNNAFKIEGNDYHTSADLTGQANYLGATLQADIIKQKLPNLNSGYQVLNTGNTSYGRSDPRMYSQLASDHPIDLCRYQVANNYMGKIGLINSGGESKGTADLKEVVRIAVINKRAGGMGIVSGRKAFQRPLKEGIAILNAIQEVYLDDTITVA